MQNKDDMWIELNESDYEKIWGKFFKVFGFNYVYPNDRGTGILEPTPSITFSLQKIFADHQAFYKAEKSINVLFHDLFKSLLDSNAWLYALDLNHPAYYFYPHHPSIHKKSFPGCLPHIFPDGDYYIFLAQDFSYGTFGHPLEQTLCVFGQQLIDALAQHQSKFLSNIIRINGKTIQKNNGYPLT